MIWDPGFKTENILMITHFGAHEIFMDSWTIIPYDQTLLTHLFYKTDAISKVYSESVHRVKCSYVSKPIISLWLY